MAKTLTTTYLPYSGGQIVTYGYNGLGDRLTQTVNAQTTTYTLDLNTGLTQVLNDGTNQYVYGVGRISQVNATTLVTDYFITDALGSVRQLTDANGEITLAKSYAPYGEATLSAGNGTSPFAYTGEQTDVSGLTYLRARYYSSRLSLQFFNFPITNYLRGATTCVTAKVQ